MARARLSGSCHLPAVCTGPQTSVAKKILATVYCYFPVQDVYGGKGGAIAQLCQLEKWFQRQREFFFYRWAAFLLGVGDLHCQGCLSKPCMQGRLLLRHERSTPLVAHFRFRSTRLPQASSSAPGACP